MAHRHRETEERPEAPATSAVPAARAWCDTCGAYRPTDEVRTGIDGDPVCRVCGEVVEFIDEDEATPKAPWHFKVLLLGTIGYLVYRVIWFIGWIQHH